MLTNPHESELVKGSQSLCGSACPRGDPPSRLQFLRRGIDQFVDFCRNLCTACQISRTFRAAEHEFPRGYRSACGPTVFGARQVRSSSFDKTWVCRSFSCASTGFGFSSAHRWGLSCTLFNFSVHPRRGENRVARASLVFDCRGLHLGNRAVDI